MLRAWWMVVPQAGDAAPPEWRGEVAVALLDTPSLLEGAFLLPAHKTLLLSDTCIMVRLCCLGIPGHPLW
jgi:hypothetical protein